MAGRKPGTPKTGGRKKGSVNKVGADLRAAAREHTEDALKTIIALMKAKTSPAAVKLRAAEFIIERGWGKATQPVEVGVKPLYAISDKPMTADEWTKLFAGESSPSGLPKPARKRRS
jgi:hypothetical protein